MRRWLWNKYAGIPKALCFAFYGFRPLAQGVGCISPQSCRNAPLLMVCWLPPASQSCKKFSKETNCDVGKAVRDLDHTT
jgi:hypothetical protein